MVKKLWLLFSNLRSDAFLVFVSIAPALSTVESDAVHAAEGAHGPGEF